jgi:hypothetical protein
MKKTKDKPIYGRSQGTRQQNTGERSTAFKYAKSCNFSRSLRHEKKINYKVRIKSFPRFLFQIVTIAAIAAWLSNHTPIGQKIAADVRNRIAQAQQSANKVKEEVNLVNLSKQHQQKTEDKFDRKWKDAGGQ